MRRSISALAFTLTFFFIGATFFIAASLVLAWTGPTSAPPNGNVYAPVNVGTVDQLKNAGLGVNSLAVFGNAILAGVSSYLNFGATAGANGYGIRDNGGNLEFKNSGGSWSSVTSTVLSGIQSFFANSANTIPQIKFTDGTTQTTAATAGGVTASTYRTCTGSYGCTATCPATYFMSGCTSSKGDATVSGSGCTCGGYLQNATCYALCVKKMYPELMPSFRTSVIIGATFCGK